MITSVEEMPWPLPSEVGLAMEHATDARIVAGVDGSASSLSALRWAIRQAGLTGAAPGRRGQPKANDR
jgi:hypothetical protein